MYRLIAFCKWCQHLPLPDLAAHVKALGFDGVDLANRPGGTIEPEESAKKLPEAKRICEDHGLTLDRLVTGIDTPDDAADRQLAAIRKVGVERIRLGGYPIPRGEEHRAQQILDDARNKLAGLQKLCEKHGVRAAIQNHSGSALEVNVSSCLLMMQDCDPAWIGIQMDPGHLCLSGEGYELAVGLMGPYLHSVNFKSARWEYYVDPHDGRLHYKPIWLPLSDGMLDVPGVLQALKAAGYSEPISIHGEYRTHYYYIEEDMAKCGELIGKDAAYVRKIMAECL